MANYPHPPFGMPFPFPPHQQQSPLPQHPVPSPQAEPPSAEALQQMWNWQAANFQMYGQNAQQPSFPAWPPPPLPQQGENGYATLPFPPTFMAPNGFAPPPPPGSHFYQPPLPQPQQQTEPVLETGLTYPPQQPMVAPVPIRTPRQSLAATSDRVTEVMDSDKEDGEVSDGGRVSKSPIGYGRAILDPPRSVPQLLEGSHLAGYRNEGRQDGGEPSNAPQNNRHYAPAHSYSGPLNHPAQDEITGPHAPDNLNQQRRDAMQFVKHLHENDVGFRSLEAEGLDPQLLGDLYRSMNLPLPSEPVQALAEAPMQAAMHAPVKPPVQKALLSAQVPSRASTQAPRPVPFADPKVKGGFTLNTTNGPTAVRYPGPISNDATQQSPQAKPTPAVKINFNQVPPVQSAKSPIDRKHYIARLQAAKMAKQSIGSQDTPPPKTAPAIGPVSTAIQEDPQSSATSNGNNIVKAKQPVAEDEKARKTELIRQRLEAMRAKQAAASSPAAPSATKPTGILATSTTVPTMSPLQSAAHTQSPTPQPAQLAQSLEVIHTSQSVLAPSVSGIPGLFMNSFSAPKAVAPVLPTESTPIPLQKIAPATTQKRTVASDFDEVNTPTCSDLPYARPFGQSPHEHDGESMIIEVSDDESGGSEMDLDDDPPVSKLSAISPPKSNQTGQQVLRNFPPLSDFPSRPASVRPVSSAVSTPGTQTPATIARKEELQKKERALAELKLDLVKKMQEQRQKKAAAAASSPVTRKVTIPVTPKQTSLNATLAPPSFMTAESTRSSLPARPVTTSNFASQDMAIESKKRRRAEIESGLPSLEAEIASNAARMAQIAKEMEELRAHNEKISQDKEHLIKELGTLGVDTEGMPHAELQAKKDEIELGLQTEPSMPGTDMVDSSTSLCQPSMYTGHENTVAPVSTTRQSGVQSDDHSKQSEDLQQLKQAKSSHDSAFAPEVGTSDTTPASPAASPATQPAVASPPLVENLTVAEPQQNGTRSPKTPSEEEDLPTEHHKPTKSASISVPVENVTESAISVNDDEDFYSPEPAVTVASENQSAIEVAFEPAVRSLSEEGEVEMSESSSSEDEDEYEPEEPQRAPPVSAGPVGQPINIADSPTSSSISSEDEEMYEPPEPIDNQKTVDVQPNSENTTSISTNQAIEEDGEMDISESSSDESDKSDSTQQPPLEHTNNNSLFFNSVPDLTIADIDNPAPQSHFQTIPVTQTVAIEPASTADAERASFVPYESPLRMFKSYRYHPTFSQDVSGGFLSMTYSHQIDPEQPLCQVESVGETCNDPECTDQHFGAMNITGEKLLVQLGTANPGKTPDEKQLWVDGLRGVLKELRQKNIKDHNGIAMEIAKYRRQFLSDDTRVVNL